MAQKDSVLKQITLPITGEADDTVNRKGSRVIAGFYTGVGVVAGSMIARYRASQGKPPIARVLF